MKEQEHVYTVYIYDEEGKQIEKRAFENYRGAMKYIEELRKTELKSRDIMVSMGMEIGIRL